MTNPFDALIRVHISGLPIGQLTKQNQHDIPNGLAKGVGRQHAQSSHLVSRVRPIRQTVFTYDEDGNETGIASVADEWILTVASASVSWADDDEMRDEIALVMAEHLDVPVAIFNNPNISVTRYDQSGIQAVAAEWDGQIG